MIANMQNEGLAVLHLACALSCYREHQRFSPPLKHCLTRNNVSVRSFGQHSRRGRQRMTESAKDSGHYQANIALEALKDEDSAAEMASRFGVHPTLIQHALPTLSEISRQRFLYRPTFGGSCPQTAMARAFPFLQMQDCPKQECGAICGAVFDKCSIKAQENRYEKDFRVDEWCPGEDSNLHVHTDTST